MVKTGLRTLLLLGAAMLCVVANAEKRAHKIWMAEVDYEFTYQGFADAEPGEMPKTAVMLVSGNNTCRTTQTEFLTASIIGNKTKNTLINLAVTPEIKSATVCDSADIVAGQASLKFDIQGKGKYKKILGYQRRRDNFSQYLLRYRWTEAVHGWTWMASYPLAFCRS